jgi:cyclophilin family peptidyl-prolyl cis-trans isomerase
MAKKNKKKTSKEASVQVKKTSLKAEKKLKQPEVQKISEKIIKEEKVTVVQKAEPTKSFYDNPQNIRKLTGVLAAITVIALFSAFMFYVIPEVVLTRTDDFVRKQEQENLERERGEKESQKEQQLAVENTVLKFEENSDWKVDLNFTNFGILSVDLKNSYAPKTVENFIRLAYRGYYDDTSIHRIVKRDNFSVIQGGDKENRDGTGGQSAFYIDETDQGLIADELYITPPEFRTEGEENILSTPPVFIAPELYGNFNADNGTVNYRKGLILMAKTNQPDSASSQFFITLKDTALPAEYTVFGVIEESDFAVLDKMFNEITPQSRNPDTTELQDSEDGTPSKDLILEKASIVSPEIN